MFVALHLRHELGDRHHQVHATREPFLQVLVRDTQGIEDLHGLFHVCRLEEGSQPPGVEVDVGILAFRQACLCPLLKLLRVLLKQLALAGLGDQFLVVPYGCLGTLGLDHIHTQRDSGSDP